MYAWHIGCAGTGYISRREVLLVHVFTVELGMDCVHALLCSDVTCSSPIAARATVGNIEILAVAGRGVSIKLDDNNTTI